MKVTLIEFTGSGWEFPEDRAADILAFTKATRLNMTPDLMIKMEARTYKDRMAELDYMANTIPSSWEFVDYTFLIEKVSRAFTQQLERTRTASFAEQSLRVVDVGDSWTYHTGPTLFDDKGSLEMYNNTMAIVANAYKTLIERGVKPEDARGLLPLNIHVNVVMKINMRNWVEMVRKRSSSRTQGEYRQALELMKIEVRKRHPWIDKFIGRDEDRALQDIENKVNNFDPFDMVNIQSFKTDIIKLVDQLRSKI